MYFSSLEHNDSHLTKTDAIQTFSTLSMIDENLTPLSTFRLKRQLATSSLDSPDLYADNNSVSSTTESESIGSLLDHIDDDNDDDDANGHNQKHQQILNNGIENENTIHQLIQTLNDDAHIKRSSYNESERTDSGIGGGLSIQDSGSWKFSTYEFQKSSPDKISIPEHFDSINIRKVPSLLSLLTQSSSISRSSSSSSSSSNENSNSELKQFPSNVISIPIYNSNYDSTTIHDSSLLKKAGWLNVKHWLTNQRKRVELASNRKWKRYWICLKGQDLLLYSDYSDIDEHINSKQSIDIRDCLCYSIPEYPKRDHVFSLATSTGDQYYFQPINQTETDNWIKFIHRTCAQNNHFRHQNIVKELKRNIHKLEKLIKHENTMHKLGELQLQVSTTTKVRQIISKQIELWEKNLEEFHVDLFRQKCYLAALNDKDLPNPKDLLIHACSGTKTTLNKLGSFTPCSFYSCITTRKQGLSNIKCDIKTRRNSNTNGQLTKCFLEKERNVTSGISSTESSTIVQMITCNNPMMKTLISITKSITVNELLKCVTNRLGLQTDDYYLQFNHNNNLFVPKKSEKLNTLHYTSIEICRKIFYQVTLKYYLISGLELDTELNDKNDRENCLQIFVSNVQNESEAEKLGIQSGDEIVLINNFVVQHMDLAMIDEQFENGSTVLIIRSSRSSHPFANSAMILADSMIQTLICPPPPSIFNQRLSRQVLKQLTVPKPIDYLKSGSLLDSDNDEYNKYLENHNQFQHISLSSPPVDLLLKNVEEVSGYCRPIYDEHSLNEQTILNEPRIKALSNAQRLRKVIFELLQTERTYVQDMERLLERYIGPLRDESLLPSDPIESLYISVQSITQLQVKFLKCLENSVPTDVLAYNISNEFQDILLSIADTFLHYASHFKMYSTFCAMHLCIHRLLENEQNPKLKAFFDARNPRHQHSSSFESYLIKPVQRILKYPLLLKQMLMYTDVNSIEKLKLSKAIDTMNDVAQYMNDMQTIYEEYGQCFEQIMKRYSNENKMTLQLTLPDLLAYGEIEWINIDDFVIQQKTKHQLETLCFIFRNGIIILCREINKNKKKDQQIKIDRFAYFIPIEQIQIVDMRQIKSTNDPLFVWELIHVNRIHFILANKNEDEKDTFINTINNCIRYYGQFSSTSSIRWRETCKSPLNNRNSEILSSSSPTRIIVDKDTPLSKSCHTLTATFVYQNDETRSPSPIWKRRNQNKKNYRTKIIRNFTDTTDC